MLKIIRELFLSLDKMYLGGGHGGHGGHEGDTGDTGHLRNLKTAP